MKAAPTLPMPARTPLALSKAGAAAAVFQRAMPKVIVPIAMATLASIFARSKSFLFGSEASVSGVVLANGVVLVSRDPSMEGAGSYPRFGLGVIAVGLERTPFSRFEIGRSAAVLVEARVLLSIGRSSAERSARVVLAMAARLKESLRRWCCYLPTRELHLRRAKRCLEEQRCSS